MAGPAQKVSAKAQQNAATPLPSRLALQYCAVAHWGRFSRFRRPSGRQSLAPHFCGISQIPCITVPSKSTLQRYDAWWPQERDPATVYELLAQGATVAPKMALPEAVDLESAFLDTTCLGAKIHYPVDWVLLRDATRTLMKAVQLIRQQGLKRRMEEPQVSLTRINRLCIQMTQSRRNTDSRATAKRPLRQMDKLVGVVRSHARRYRALLDQRWEQTQWSRKQSSQSVIALPAPPTYQFPFCIRYTLTALPKVTGTASVVFVWDTLLTLIRIWARGRSLC